MQHIPRIVTEIDHECIRRKISDKLVYIHGVFQIFTRTHIPNKGISF